MSLKFFAAVTKPFEAEIGYDVISITLCSNCGITRTASIFREFFQSYFRKLISNVTVSFPVIHVFVSDIAKHFYRIGKRI